MRQGGRPFWAHSFRLSLGTYPLIKNAQAGCSHHILHANRSLSSFLFTDIPFLKFLSGPMDLALFFFFVTVFIDVCVARQREREEGCDFCVLKTRLFGQAKHVTWSVFRQSVTRPGLTCLKKLHGWLDIKFRCEHVKAG